MPLEMFYLNRGKQTNKQINISFQITARAMKNKRNSRLESDGAGVDVLKPEREKEKTEQRSESRRFLGEETACAKALGRVWERETEIKPENSS